nr:PREDICTED: zinc finger protein 804B [Opisthocomus hoazin]
MEPMLVKMDPPLAKAKPKLISNGGTQKVVKPQFLGVLTYNNYIITDIREVRKCGLGQFMQVSQGDLELNTEKYNIEFIIPEFSYLRTKDVGQDYAEKEKAAAKALEDVKANFYCELCDKQYHKHQEFDNHINSYDHAHKQRLKDLKQREFARNVASKSWKDEKKQEKALKRLHQLAELRKQSECSITGNGPLLKAPRLVMEKQQSPDGIFLYKGSKFTANSQQTTTSEGQGSSSNILEKQQRIISKHQSPTERPHALGDQVSQVLPDSTNTSQRAGVSFSFSKKVPLKLESSASVFSENSEEGNDCSESPNHKIKQALEGCRFGTLSEEDMKASLDKAPPITHGQMDLDNCASSHAAAKPKMLRENEESSDMQLEEKVNAHPPFSKVKIQLSNLDFSGSLRETEQESKLNESEQLLETLISPSCQASNFYTQPKTYKHSNAHLPDQLPELPQQPEPQLACASNISDGPGVVNRESSLESSETTNGSMETLPRETMVKENKPQALPFLHVVSKDGTTALQWPTELLLFTKTEPCISYGCNPLYFDFRLSLNHRDATDYGHCLFKDIIQIGTGYQSPSINRNTAIKEEPNLFISEVQPFIQSCDPVPNDFPGAFPPNRYSVVANSTETKEELRDVNMDSNQAEGSSDSVCDNAMQKYDDTVNHLEVYSKSTSPPLTQQPVTFSPEEVDKYRLLQLQAQQHMQKQLLAKHLKVFPAPGPAAFSTTPAVPALPAQQHATVTTVHHTLLQRFAVSASVHPHGSHLSLAHLHPLSQAHFTPISLSPLVPALIPTHPALLTGHPLHLVSTNPLHPSPLTFPALPHTTYIPALFTPHLNAATPSVIHPNPLVHPLFQGQEPHCHSSQTQQLPTIKEVFSVSSYLN